MSAGHNQIKTLQRKKRISGQITRPYVKRKDGKMIKKTLVLAALAAFMVNGAIAAETATQNVPTKETTQQTQPALPDKATAPVKPEFDAPPPPPCPKAKSQFEKRLKLTDEQKEQAKQLRIKGHEKMEPIFAKIKELKQEKEMVLRSRMAVEMQKEKVAEIDAQIRDLKKQAHELRIQNMKDFEAILTDKQKKELKKMKKEGRKKFEKARKKCIKEGTCRPMRPHPTPMPEPQPMEPVKK